MPDSSRQHAGTSRAQVIRYIDLQLTRRFKKLQEPYRRAAEAIDETARRAHGKPFDDLTPEQQTSILARIKKATRCGARTAARRLSTWC